MEFSIGVRRRSAQQQALVSYCGYRRTNNSSRSFVACTPFKVPPASCAGIPPS
jgi:hypothetical protein